MNSPGFAPENAPTIVPALDGAEVVCVAVKTSRQDREKESVGQRLARLRRERGLTQVELAEKLGVVQPIISGYERGELRLHGQVIVGLTRVLRVSADELLGLEKSKTGTTVRNRRLLRRLQELDRLPRRDQQALLRTIDAFLAKAS
jgi:transcriptional regulator with XRE-family HTH domain